MAWSIICSLALLASASELTFTKGGKTAAVFTPEALSAKVAPVDVSFFDPHHGRNKRYRCWPIKAVMDAAYGKAWDRTEYSEIVLTARDGYASQSAAGKLTQDGGCLAFADLDAGVGWEPIGRKKADPGPYYLVWTKPEQSTENAYPWPWQLASIGLIRFEDRYPEVVARGAKAGSPEFKGFETFRSQCMRCHSINQQGGKIGPDLNAPKSVTSYRTKEWFASYVRAPSKYRYTEMPDHPHLTDADLSDLWAYFGLKAAQPEKTW